MAKKKKRRSKKQAVTPARNRQPLPAWMILALGVLMGSSLALFLMLNGFVPREDATSPTSEPEPEATTGAEEPEWQPSYDFYTVLPEKEVVIPEPEAQREATEDANASYLLQIGSFQDYADADRLKAKLALLGVRADIRDVSVDGDEWHRVRIGPLANTELESTLSKLRASGYDPLILKERG